MQNRQRLMQPIVRGQVHNYTNSHQWPEIWVTAVTQQQTTKYERIHSKKKKKMCRWVNLVKKKSFRERRLILENTEMNISVCETLFNKAL